MKDTDQPLQPPPAPLSSYELKETTLPSSSPHTAAGDEKGSEPHVSQSLLKETASVTSLDSDAPTSSSLPQPHTPSPPIQAPPLTHQALQESPSTQQAPVLTLTPSALSFSPGVKSADSKVSRGRRGQKKTSPSSANQRRRVAESRSAKGLALAEERSDTLLDIYAGLSTGRKAWLLTDHSSSKETEKSESSVPLSARGISASHPSIEQADSLTPLSTTLSTERKLDDHHPSNDATEGSGTLTPLSAGRKATDHPVNEKTEDDGRTKKIAKSLPFKLTSETQDAGTDLASQRVIIKAKRRACKSGSTGAGSPEVGVASLGGADVGGVEEVVPGVRGAPDAVSGASPEVLSKRKILQGRRRRREGGT